MNLDNIAFNADSTSVARIVNSGIFPVCVSILSKFVSSRSAPYAPEHVEMISGVLNIIANLCANKHVYAVRHCVTDGSVPLVLNILETHTVPLLKSERVDFEMNTDVLDRCCKILHLVNEHLKRRFSGRVKQIAMLLFGVLSEFVSSFTFSLAESVASRCCGSLCSALSYFENFIDEFENDYSLYTLLVPLLTPLLQKFNVFLSTCTKSIPSFDDKFLSLVLRLFSNICYFGSYSSRTYAYNTRKVFFDKYKGFDIVFSIFTILNKHSVSPSHSSPEASSPISSTSPSFSSLSTSSSSSPPHPAISTSALPLFSGYLRDAMFHAASCLCWLLKGCVSVSCLLVWINRLHFFFFLIFIYCYH
jgi:hypothetical protein